jgi:hypothetical protein
VGVAAVKIYLVLTETGSIVSRLIGFYTKARYNHVSLCLNDDMQEFYSFGRKIMWFPLIGGFVVEHIDSGVYKVFADTNCIIYKLDIDEGKFRKLKTTVDSFIENKDLYGFNLIGLLGIILKVPLKSKNRYFCAQFVAAMLYESGIFDFSKDASLVTPEDFHRIPGLVTVYKGRLSEFTSFRNTMNIVTI